MPTKKNFLGGQQNYNKETGEYESSLVGPSGKVVKDADGDGKTHESGSKNMSSEVKDAIVDNIWSKYSRTPREVVYKIAEEENFDKDRIEERLVNDPQVLGSNNYQKQTFTGDKFLSEEHLDYLFEKNNGDENAVLDEIRHDPEYQKSEITNSDLQGIVEVHQMKKSFNSINKKRMGY